MTIKRAVEHTFTGSTIKYSDTYDSSKTVLGKWIVQNTGVNSYDKYAGPFPIVCARPMQETTAISSGYPHVIDLGNNIHWVFLAEISAAAATRRIILYTFNTSTQVMTWRGFITLTYPTATAHTIRGFRVQRHLYTTGTVAVSGTAVTGTSTAWQTARYAVGARIGFGSTDPNAISTWYTISAIGSDTSITLSGSAGTISAGTAFVIEELRIITATTNATAANGGLFVAKGVNYDLFISGGTTISAATTTDNLRAVYWLADASTVLNTAAGGVGLTTASDTSQIVYVINADAATTLRVYKYDIRAALSGLSAGKSTSAFLFKSGANTVTGTISQTNSSRMAALNHGPGAGTSCLYLATTTRVLRCPETAIMDGSTSIVSDSMVEMPPGGTITTSLSNNLSSVEYSSVADELIITSATLFRSYITKYQTNVEQFDRYFSCNTNAQDQSTANAGLPPTPHSSGASFSVWAEDGILYLSRMTTAATTNQLYILPLASDSDFFHEHNGRLISPKIITPNCSSYSRLSVLSSNLIGSSSLGIQTENWRVFYRTSGINDNTGAWTLIDSTGDLSSATGSPAIQFMFDFRVIGPMCLAAKIHGFIVSYNDNNNNTYFQPSAYNSLSSKRQFSWRFASAVGGTVPTLTIKIFNASTGDLLLTDTTTTSTSGLWEKSINGGGLWTSYNTSDKSNETTYIRYTPTSFPNNITARATLSV